MFKQSLQKDRETPQRGKCFAVGCVGKGWSEMDPLSSLVLTSYWLPIVTMGLSLHRFYSAPTCHGQTVRQNWSSKRWHYGLKCIGREKPPN